MSPDALMNAVRAGHAIEDGDEALTAAIEYLRSFIRSALEIDEGEELPADLPLAKLGVDSLLGLDIQDRVNEDLGVFLNPSTLTDDPTLTELARMLIGELAVGPSR